MKNNEAIYDAQIERLTNNPKLIWMDWATGHGLFAFAAATVFDILNPDCGCLTHIRQGSASVVVRGQINYELTAAIKSDERIPRGSRYIRTEHLLVFKEWQMKLDELRTPATPD